MTESIEQINSDVNSLSLILPSFNRNLNQRRKMPKRTFILARTIMEKLHFRAIQSLLKEINVEIRTVDQSYILYICHNDHWYQQVNDFFEKMDVYSLIGEMKSSSSSDNNNNNNNNHCQKILKVMCDQTVSLLHHLFIRKAITIEQYKQMIYFNQLSTLSINKLYFVPKLDNMNISIQPMLTNFENEPMKAIARFLNILLEPLYEKVTHSNICYTGADTIQAFEKYANKGYLQSTTLLVSIQIHNLCTIFKHNVMIEKLKRFLQIQSIEGTSKTAIIQLTQLLLANQYFLHENKLYQQMAGGSLGSPLIKTLADIYLWCWEMDLVSILKNRRELFGQRNNEIFFTWNESKHKLQILIDEMINNMDSFKNTNIQITTSIGHKIHYLDAEFGHDHGLLQTKVFHQQSIEPYELPYVYDTHRRQSHTFLLRAALIRAILYCSNVNEFENERFYIELSFIINNDSLDFIENTIDNFIRKNVYAVSRDLDQQTYDRLRKNVKLYHEHQMDFHIQKPYRRQ